LRTVNIDYYVILGILTVLAKTGEVNNIERDERETIQIVMRWMMARLGGKRDQAGFLHDQVA
jgi:hypothetical protein